MAPIPPKPVSIRQRIKPHRPLPIDYPLHILRLYQPDHTDFNFNTYPSIDNASFHTLSNNPNPPSSSMANQPSASSTTLANAPISSSPSRLVPNFRPLATAAESMAAYRARLRPQPYPYCCGYHATYPLSSKHTQQLTLARGYHKRLEDLLPRVHDRACLRQLGRLAVNARHHVSIYVAELWEEYQMALRCANQWVWRDQAEWDVDASECQRRCESAAVRVREEIRGLEKEFERVPDGVWGMCRF